MASDLMQKMMKNTEIKGVSSLEESTFFGHDIIQTPLLAMNVALSGTLYGGMSSGITTIAGMSRTFKTLFGLMLMKSYLDKYPESIAIFYDTEFGSTPEYMKTFGIDTSRVIHIPIKNIEELKFDIVKKLEGFDKRDKVFFFIDSIGNLASKKEIDDALDSKSVADMTRAKQMKSFGRMVTPYLSINDIPLVQIGHTYQTQDRFPQDIVSGGCVVEGTKIQMADGSLQEVQNINVDDLVQTIEGPKAVTSAWNPDTLLEGNPECLEIEFEDGHKVICSEDHKFLIGGEWIEAKNLIVGNDCLQI